MINLRSYSGLFHDSCFPSPPGAQWHAFYLIRLALVMLEKLLWSCWRSGAIKKPWPPADQVGSSQWVSNEQWSSGKISFWCNNNLYSQAHNSKAADEMMGWQGKRQPTLTSGFISSLTICRSTSRNKRDAKSGQPSEPVHAIFPQSVLILGQKFGRFEQDFMAMTCFFVLSFRGRKYIPANSYVFCTSEEQVAKVLCQSFTTIEKWHFALLRYSCLWKSIFGRGVSLCYAGVQVSRELSCSVFSVQAHVALLSI